MSQKTLAGIIIFVIAFVVFWWLLLPAYFDFSAARVLKAQKENDLAKQNLILEKVGKWKEELESNKDNVARLAEALPAESDLPRLISLADNLAKQSGLIVVSFDIKETEENKRTAIIGSSLPVQKFGTTIIEGKFQGSYESLLKFLGGLENSLRSGDVNKLEISPAKDSNNFDAFLRVKFYREKR